MFLLKERGHLMMKMNVTFRKGNEVSNSSSYNNFFEDSIILWESNEKKTFFLGGGRDTDISSFYVKIIDNTIETIDGFAKIIDSYWLLHNTKMHQD